MDAAATLLQILPPTPAQIAANNGSLAANGTGELGCAVAENALMFGTVVRGSQACACQACLRVMLLSWAWPVPLSCTRWSQQLVFYPQVATLDGVDSPAACCAACQRLGWGPAGAGFVDAPNVTGCNAYNLCTRPGGCRCAAVRGSRYTGEGRWALDAG